MRGLQCVWLTLATVLLCLLGTTELSFYQEFHQRLNTLVFQYLQEDPATVLSMLWYGFPVLRLLLGLALVSWLMYRSYRWLDRRTRLPATADNRQRSQMGALAARVSVLLLLLVSSTVLARGTLRQGPPLRWGDAFTTESTFANQLGLTPALTLYAAAKAQFSDHRDNAWLGLMDDGKATAITRDLLLTANDQLIDADQAPVRRVHDAWIHGSLR